MIRLVLLISLTFTQCIAQKSKQNAVFDSVAGRASVADSIEPDNSKCSDPAKGGGSCTSIFRCPKLFELYRRSRTLSSKEIKSLEDAFCGWSQGAPYVCCPAPSTNELHCGDSVVKDRNLVTGGKRAILGAWPWMTALFMRSDRTKKTSFRCGGSLISKEWVLTAAHCVPEAKDEKLVHVRLGDLNIDDAVPDGATPIDIDIKEVIMHSEYTKGPVTNDIALLRLSKPVEYDENIRPICLHSGKTFQQNMTLYDRKKPFIAGWGAVEYLGERSDHLLDAEIYAVPIDKCSKNYSRFIESKQIKIDDRIVCASAPDKDTCQGDSGGPLMMIDNGFWYQIGVVSVGYECNNEGYPGVYTKVVSFIDWINKTTGFTF